MTGQKDKSRREIEKEHVGRMNLCDVLAVNVMLVGQAFALCPHTIGVVSSCKTGCDKRLSSQRSAFPFASVHIYKEHERNGKTDQNGQEPESL